MRCTKLRLDLILSKADSGKQSPYSQRTKARQGVCGDYPEREVRAQRLSVSLGAPRLDLVLISFCLFSRAAQ